MIMDAKDIQTEKDSETWVKHAISDILDELNNKKNSMTDLAPAIAIKRKTVKLKHKYPPEEVLPEDWLYRYLYQTGEWHGDQRQRSNRLELVQEHL